MSSADTITVNVDLGERAYDILIGPGLLTAAADHIAPHLARSKTAIITDENVAAAHLGALQDALSAGGIEHETLVLPAGESTKSNAHLFEATDFLLSAGKGKKKAVPVEQMQDDTAIVIQNRIILSVIQF